MKFTSRVFIALLVCTVAAGAAMAQTTRGDIQGFVTDESGVAEGG